jgi:hypothetical protein
MAAGVSLYGCAQSKRRNESGHWTDLVTFDDGLTRALAEYAYGVPASDDNGLAQIGPKKTSEFASMNCICEVCHAGPQTLLIKYVVRRARCYVRRLNQAGNGPNVSHLCTHRSSTGRVWWLARFLLPSPLSLPTPLALHLPLPLPLPFSYPPFDAGTRHRKHADRPFTPTEAPGSWIPEYEKKWRETHHS